MATAETTLSTTGRSLYGEGVIELKIIPNTQNTDDTIVKFSFQKIVTNILLRHGFRY